MTRLPTAALVFIIGSLCSCGGSHATIVEITFDAAGSPPAGVSSIALVLTLDGKSASVVFSKPSGTIALPTTGAVEVGDGLSGTLGIDATAKSSTGAELAHGTATCVVTNQATTQVTLRLGGVAVTDLGADLAPSDLGSPDLARPDLGSEDLAREDLARADLASQDLAHVAAADLSGDLAPPPPHLDLGAADLAPPPCPIVYVSASSGLATNDGCSPQHPKATITQALTVSKATTVEVCAGTYTEDLTVSGAIALRGGYSCATWSRGPSFGPPSFDSGSSTYQTIIAAPSPSPSPITATVTLGPTGTAVLDGFTVRGPSAGAGGVAAVAVTSASEISNCNLVGGTTLSSPTGSIGLWVQSSAPHIHDNQIAGGGGACDTSQLGVNSAGSIGVVLAGSGSFTTADAFERNVISGGSGGCSKGRSGSVGLRLSGSVSAAVSDNTINGGTGTGAVDRAIDSASTGTVSIFRNRLYGGDSPVAIHAIDVGDAGGGAQIQNSGLQIFNNMIDAGTLTSSGSVAWPEALWVTAANTTIVHNTIFTGVMVNASAVAHAIHIVSGSATPTGTRIENNLFIGGYGEGTYYAGVRLDGSNYGSISTFKNNVTMLSGSWTAGSATGIVCKSQFSCTATVADTESAINGAAGAASGNLLIAQSCTTGDTSCIATSACSSGCPSAIFSAWDNGPPPGKATLLALQGGWPLATTADCRIISSSLDDAATYSPDFYGNARTSKPSIGAGELDFASCP